MCCIEGRGEEGDGGREGGVSSRLSVPFRFADADLLIACDHQKQERGTRETNLDSSKVGREPKELLLAGVRPNEVRGRRDRAGISEH